MTFPLRRFGILVALLSLAIPVGGCGSVTKVTEDSRSEAVMTPEESRQVLIAEAKAIIQAIFPGADPLVVVEIEDAPCGGPAGTDHSSVTSGINVRGDAKDKTLTSDNAFQQAVDVLRLRGWTINYTRDNVAGAQRKGVGGVRIGVSDSPVGINISGDTECVDNPNF